MSVFQHWCIRCGKKLKRGDAVIRFSKFHIYHPDCYKEDRQKAFEDIGQLDQRFLGEIHLHIDAFRTVVDSESITESKPFYETWGKHLLNINLLDCVLANAEMFGSLGFIQKIRMRRKLKRFRNTLIEIGTSYREVYGTIQIERRMKELYPSSGEPTIEQLKEGEKEALGMLKKQIIELCDNLETLHNDVKMVSKKTAYKARQEMRSQIQKIPKLIETL